MRGLFLALLSLFSIVSFGQEPAKTWTLQSSVQYALEHNLSIKQSELNARLAKFQLLQSQLAQLPSVNASGNYGRSYGRSVDPTTNQFANTGYSFVGASGSADVLLFGWFQRRNNITANKHNLEATKADLDQLMDDVSLNVATGYLRALLAKQQVLVSEKQVSLSKAQYDQTKKFVEVGRLPALNAAQLESQLANDSATLINSIAAYNSAILDIKALLNLNFATSYEVEAPEVSVQDEISLSELAPEAIYAEARKHFGAVRGSELKYLAAQRRLAAAKGALYPQLSLSAQFGTNYASTYSEVTGVNLGSGQPTGAYVPVNDSLSFPVFQPSVTYTTQKIPFGRQVENNFRQTISLSVNIPLFNGWQAQYNVRQARINALSAGLNKEQAELNLRQNVFKAYNDAINALQKYYASQRAVNAAQRAYDFAQKRYELGLTNTVEYLTTQNAQFVSESNLNSAKYDLLFKLKVIDYYLGKELKL